MHHLALGLPHRFERRFSQVGEKGCISSGIMGKTMGQPAAGSQDINGNNTFNYIAPAPAERISSRNMALATIKGTNNSPIIRVTAWAKNITVRVARKTMPRKLKFTCLKGRKMRYRPIIHSGRSRGSCRQKILVKYWGSRSDTGGFRRKRSSNPGLASDWRFARRCRRKNYQTQRAAE